MREIDVAAKDCVLLAVTSGEIDQRAIRRRARSLHAHVPHTQTQFASYAYTLIHVNIYVLYMCVYIYVPFSRQHVYCRPVSLFTAAFATVSFLV